MTSLCLAERATVGRSALKMFGNSAALLINRFPDTYATTLRTGHLQGNPHHRRARRTLAQFLHRPVKGALGLDDIM
jgi:hypothetical protein